MNVILSIAVMSFLASVACADEVKVATGAAVQDAIANKVRDSFEKATGHKVVFVSDRDKDGAAQFFKYVIEGRANVGLTTGAWEVITEAVRDKVKAEDIKKMTHRVVAGDEMKVFASVKTGVKKVNDGQILKLFTGEIRNWKEIGGNDVPVQIVLFPGYAATNTFFMKKMMGGKKYPDNVINVDSVPEMIKKVGATPGGLGIVTFPTKSPEVLDLETERPIGRPWTAYTIGRAKPHVEAFLNHMTKVMATK